MASLTTRANGTRFVQFTDTGGRRRTIGLGRMPKRQAESVRVHVEAIAAARWGGSPLPRGEAEWVASVSDELHERMARVGLVEARQNAVTLDGWIRKYAEGRRDVKASTKQTWERARKHLVGFFGADRPLDAIGHDGALRFALSLVEEKGLSKQTARRTTGLARQFFAAAVGKGLVEENPFDGKDLPVAVGANKERQRYVPRETILRAIEATPDTEWKLVIALARFAGLRVPSEPLAMKWEHVDWPRDRMTVPSPKTEHHEGGESRVVPIFTELRPYLEAARDEAEPGAEFVIARLRFDSGNYATTFKRILKAAGVDPWPRLWNNLRSSCETDLVERFPLPAVCDWLGNSGPVAMKHYLQTRQADFEAATAQHDAQRAASATDREGPRKDPAIGPDGASCGVLRPGAGPGLDGTWAREDHDDRPESPTARG